MQCYNSKQKSYINIVACIWQLPHVISYFKGLENCPVELAQDCTIAYTKFSRNQSSTYEDVWACASKQSFLPNRLINT